MRRRSIPLWSSQRRGREIDRRLLAAVLAASAGHASRAAPAGPRHRGIPAAPACPAGSACPGRPGRARAAGEQPRRFQPGQRVGLARHHRHQRPPEVPRQQAAHPRRRRHRQAHHLGTAPQQGAIGRTATQRPGELLPHAIAHGRQVYRPPAGTRGSRRARRARPLGGGSSYLMWVMVSFPKLMPTSQPSPFPERASVTSPLVTTVAAPDLTTPAFASAAA